MWDMSGGSGGMDLSGSADGDNTFDSQAGTVTYGSTGLVLGKKTLLIGGSVAVVTLLTAAVIVAKKGRK
jgi:hypothetical protein